MAIVEEPRLRLLDDCTSVYELAGVAIAAGKKLGEVAQQRASNGLLDYEPIYEGHSEWQILPPIDHPDDAARCLISGTGLTHLGSARNRQSMHVSGQELVTDSMRMFRWGVEGGRPQPGVIGTSPEWFYKGNAVGLRAHGEALRVPPFALDGGEEAEIAGIYIISTEGHPYRIGMAIGNEFSDHRFEKTNYLYLASSKLRDCALGPELTLDPEFGSVAARVAVERDRKQIWAREFLTGEAEMCHSLENIEHHHFKFPAHRRPGDLHIHFFGTECLSFSDGIRLEEGDIMEIGFKGFGRPLRNSVNVDSSSPELVCVRSL